jgi:hypothetical protein
MRHIWLPSLRRHHPRSKQEQQGKMQHIQTVRESGYSVRGSRIETAPSSNVHLKDTEKKQTERDSNSKVATEYG